jgi:hypothetical protein
MTEDEADVTGSPGRGAYPLGRSSSAMWNNARRRGKTSSESQA